MTDAPRLTPRQEEIALLLHDGKSVVEIAVELRCSVATVRTHVRTVAQVIPNPHGLPAVRLIKQHVARRPKKSD